MLNVCKDTLRRWDQSGKLKSVRHSTNNYRVYRAEDIQQFEQLDVESAHRFEAHKSVVPRKIYHVMELFAGAGGLALGLEKAGLHCAVLSELNKNACNTLRLNRPKWHVIEGDVRDIDFVPYAEKIDILIGGFPCQAFSFAGRRLGFEDARGTLFYEFACRTAKVVYERLFSSIGNAVPVNLAHAVGLELVRTLNEHVSRNSKSHTVSKVKTPTGLGASTKV